MVEKCEVKTPRGALGNWVPGEVRSLADLQTAIPALAKDVRLMGLIDHAVRSIPTAHQLFLCSCETRGLSEI